MPLGPCRYQKEFKRRSKAMVPLRADGLNTLLAFSRASPGVRLVDDARHPDFVVIDLSLSGMIAVDKG